MSARHDRRLANLTLEQKVGARVSDRYWPMQQMLGKDQQGRPITREIYVDMRSGASHTEKAICVPPDGWDGVPGDLPSGDPGKQFCYQPASALFRRNYERIDWER